MRNVPSVCVTETNHPVIKFEEKKSDISYDTYRKIKDELSGIDTIVNNGIKEAIETYKNDAYKAIERVFK